MQRPRSHVARGGSFVGLLALVNILVGVFSETS